MFNAKPKGCIISMNNNFPSADINRPLVCVCLVEHQFANTSFASVNV